MAPRTDFSSWFNSPDEADVLLHLTVSTLGTAKQAQTHDRTYHAHALILKSMSKYFKACLTSDWQQQQQQQSEKQQKQEDRQEEKQKQQQHQQEQDDQSQDQEKQQEDGQKQEGQQPGTPQKTDSAAPTSATAAAATAAASQARYELVEHVEADELEPMEQLLRLMYSQQVPADTAAEHAFQMLRLADRYQVTHCTELLAHLAAQLAAKGKDGISASTLNQVGSLPPGLHSHPGYHSLMRVCVDFAASQLSTNLGTPRGERHRAVRRLLNPEAAADTDLVAACKLLIVRQFQDVPAVIRSDELRQQFCALPFAAVLAWAESDQLQVHSENCVVYLLSAWVAAQNKVFAPHKASPEQLEQLAHSVRVLHLGPAYQYFVLPDLAWFKACSGMPHLRILLAFKGTNSEGEPVFPSPYHGEAEDCSWKWSGPAAWVAGPRQQVDAADEHPLSTESTLSWELSPSELQQLYSGRQVWSTSHVYINGFQVQCSVERNTNLEQPTSGGGGTTSTTTGLGLGGSGQVPSSGLKQRVTLGMSFRVCPTTMSDLGITTASLVFTVVEFKVNGPNAADAKAAAMAGTRTGLGDLGAVWGYDDVLYQSAPTLDQLVVPLLVDGKLRVQMTVSGVDLPA